MGRWGYIVSRAVECSLDLVEFLALTIAKLNQPLTLHLGQCLGSVAFLMGGCIEVAHDRDGHSIVDRPERHQEVLCAGFHEAPAQAQDALTDLGLPGAGVARRKGDEPGVVQL